MPEDGLTQQEVKDERRPHEELQHELQRKAANGGGRPPPDPASANGQAASAEAFQQGLRPGVASAARGGSRPRWWRDRRRRRMLAGADALVAGAIGAAVVLLESAPGAWALAGVPVGLFTAKVIGLYDSDHRAIRHLTIDELPSLAVWSGIVAVACALLTPGSISATEILVVMVPATLVLGALRAFARLLWRVWTPPESTLVLGSGAPARAIARKIELFADMHLHLVRVEEPAREVRHEVDGEDAAMEHALSGVDRVVLAWSDSNPRLIQRLVAHCRRLEVKLSVVSPFRGGARPTPTISQVADLPLLEYNTWDVPRSTAAIKRGFDIAGSSLALLVLAPVFIAIAIAIKLDDGGPVLFRQLRAGRNHRKFQILKFRSMCVDAEQQLPGLVDLDALESPMFKLRRDPRITRVGRFLRRHSLDELPQLINVLRGEMSLVGPRPEQVDLVDRYSEEHRFRLAVKPGVTGPMQVFGRGELSFEERLAVEIDYVENVSVSRDLMLLAQTVPAVARGNGAF